MCPVRSLSCRLGHRLFLKSSSSLLRPHTLSLRLATHRCVRNANSDTYYSYSLIGVVRGGRAPSVGRESAGGFAADAVLNRGGCVGERGRGGYL